MIAKLLHALFDRIPPDRGRPRDPDLARVRMIQRDIYNRVTMLGIEVSIARRDRDARLPQ